MNFVGFFVYVILPIFAGIYWLLKKKYSYFAELGIPCETPSLIFGNLSGVGKTMHMAEKVTEIYERQKEKDVMVGFYALITPQIIATDLELIKNITVKDFNNFVNRGMYINEEVDPLSSHLFSIENEQWRFLRNKLSPAFTSGKIKSMFNIITQKGNNFKEALEKAAKVGSFEGKHMFTSFTTDVISSCAFGMETNTLNGENQEIMKIAREVFGEDSGGALRFFLLVAFPKVARFFNMPVFNKKVNEFFFDVIGGNIKQREDNNVSRKDFLDMLIQLKNKGSIDGEISTDTKKMTLNQSVAEGFLFFFAGSDTSSTAISFAAVELANNQKVQDKLRKEILEKTEATKGEINYENLHEMTYLNQVVNETLRKYPPAGFALRKAQEDYQVPNSKHTIPAGTQIMIPTISIHNDPRYYDNPAEFRPERFTSEEIEKRPHFTFMPFGEGPRNCIGMRFALINVKYAIAALIRDFKLSPDSRIKYPIKLDPKAAGFTPQGGFWTRIEKIK